MKKISAQAGFVLTEFVIALPLVILLLFALGQMTYKIFSVAKIQAADYVLASEAQNVLERITTDAKSAHSVKITKNLLGLPQYQEIFFNYHILKENANSRNIVDIIYTHRFTVAAPQATATSKNRGPYVYAERMQNDQKTNPITGMNFFGDTRVSKLKFSVRKKILYVEIEMQSVPTKKKFTVSTAIFMPAYEGEDIP